MNLQGLYRKLRDESPEDIRNVQVRSALIGLFVLLEVVFLPLWDLHRLLMPLLFANFIALCGNCLYLVAVIRGKLFPHRVYVAAFFDILSITVGIHYLGGITTNFSWVYATALITITFYAGIRMGVYVVVLCSLMNSGLMVAEWTGIIEPIDVGMLDPAIMQQNSLYLFARLLSDNILFFVIVGMTGLLSERLRRTNRNLKGIVVEHSEEIARRKEIEEKLEASEEHYRLLADHITDIIWILSLETMRFTYFSPSVRAFGFTVEEAMGLSMTDLLTPSSAEIAQQTLAEELANEHLDPRSRPRSRTLELEQLNKDGSKIWIEIKVTFLRDETGRPVSMLGVTRDITSRKHAEEELKNSEERLKLLFEYAPDAYLLYDAKGRLVDGNKAAEELVGYKKEELIGKRIQATQILSPDQLSIAAQTLAQNVQHKPSTPVELVLNRRDGGQATVEIATYPVKIGDQLLTLGIARDITERKKLQQQLFQAQKMESIGTLAGGIAHDFNNILGGILGYASFMKTKVETSHPFFRYIETIENGAERAADLTSQLLAFARGGKYETRPVCLNTIVEETLRILSRTFNKSIEIRTLLEKSLPMVEADAGQMQQLLLNLCVNANDAMPDRGQLTIETGVQEFFEDTVIMNEAATPGLYVSLRVSDTGAGMDRKTIERIFEPFYTTKEQGKGTGLGLSMVFGVVKNHNGFIDVASEPGVGSVFTIYLPPSKTAEAKEPGSATQKLGEGEFILIVDDDESIRSMARDILEGHGYGVMLAEDGEHATEIFQQHNGNIRLVILDMVMPRIGGHETFLRLKALNPDVKAILSTGYGPSERAQEILNSGVMDFIQKPYRADNLLSKVNGALEMQEVR